MTQTERLILQLIESNPMISQQAIAQQLNISQSAAAACISDLISTGCISGRGFVLKNSTYAVVVGGVNMDIGGSAFRPLVAADSNPGSVHLSLGGVGRNIAHNLSLMGKDVRMLTAIGDDIHGRQAAASFAQLGIDGTHALVIPGATTSTYLYLTDPAGEMALAVSDMAICEKITPRYLSENLSLLQGAQVVVMDTNIPQESLQYLANTCEKPIFCDPVSTAKAVKLLPILSKIHTLKPNRIEAEVLTGMEIHTMEDAQAAAQKLLDKGVHRVFLSMGDQGVCAADENRCIRLSNPLGRLVSTTGCGDAFTAALVWAYLEGMDLENTAQAGLAAASIAMESQETIHPGMSAPWIRSRMAKETSFDYLNPQ